MADNIDSILSGNFGGNKDNEPNYLSKSGYDLLSDQDAISEVRDYYAANGVYFNNTSEMWDKFYTDRRWSDVNTLSMGLDALEYASGGDEGKEKLARLSKLWAQAPSRGSTLDKVIDYGTAGILDPTNLIGVGAAGAAVKAGNATRLAGNTLEQARKAGTKAGIKRAAAGEAGIGFGIGAGFDAAQQSMEIAQGVSDEFSIGRLATSAVLDAGVSAGAAALLAKGGSMLGIGDVAKGVGSLGDWDNTRLGSMLVEEQSAITRERESITAAMSGVTDQAELDNMNAALSELTMNERNIANVQRYINDMDLELDSVATRYQDALANGNDAEAAQLKEYFDGLIAKRARALSMEPDELFASGEINLQQRPEAPQAEEPTGGDGPQEGGTQEGGTQNESANDQGEATSDERPEGTQDEGANDGDQDPDLEPKGKAPENAQQDKPWNWQSDNQRKTIGKKLGLDGEDLDEEVQRRVNSGEFKVTQTGAKGGGKLYKNTLKGDAAPAKQEVAEVVDEPKQEIEDAQSEAPEDQTTDVAEADEDTDGNAAAFDEAVRKYERIMDLSKGSSEFMDNINSIIDGMLAAGEIDGQVFRYLRQLLGMHADAEAKGKNVANADQLVKMRKEFLAREQTLPDFEDPSLGTAKRSAQSTEKASKALEEGDVNAGMAPLVTYDKKTGERKVTMKRQSFLRRGFDTGDGYSVLNAGDRFPKQKLTLETLRALAKKEGENGRHVYAFRAVGGEPVIGKSGPNKRIGRAKKGETVYYSPRLDKVFRTEQMAMQALGILKNKKSKAAARNQSPEPLTSGEAVSARDKAFEDFKKTGSLQKLEEDIGSVDEATGQVDDKPARNVKKGGIIKREDIPDMPREMNGKIFAMIPREVGKKGTWFRKIRPNQTDPREVIMRANLDDYYVGYVSEGMTAKNRKALLENFEPFDDMNDPRFNDAEPERLAFPIEEEWAQTHTIDLDELSQVQRDSVILAADVVRNSTSIPTRLIDNLKNNNATLYDLHLLIVKFDRLPFMSFKGTGIRTKKNQLPMAHRIALYKNLLEVKQTFAPDGIRYNSTTLEESIRNLKQNIIATAPASTKLNFEKMLRDVVPEGNAPIFRQGGEFENYFTSAARPFRKNYSNTVTLENTIRSVDPDTGDAINSEFIFAHELGHWMWVNVIDDDLRVEFVKAMDKYYDENGRLYPDAMEEVYKKSPVYRNEDGDMFGTTNFGDSFQEYYANQFALWINKRHDLLSVKDENLWQRIANIVKAFLAKLNGEEIIDQDMLPLFDKLIIDDAKAQKVSVMAPVEPKTKKGGAIQARFVMMSEAFYSARSAYSNGDLDMAAEKLSDLASEFRGMVTTKKEAGIIAKKNDEPLRPYSGAFMVVKRHHAAMRNMAQQIESVTRKFKMDVKTSKGELFDGIGFGPEVYEGVQKIFEETNIAELIDDVQATMNNAYLDVEMGDIPQYKATQTEITRREELPNGAETIKRAQRFKRVKGRANAAKRKRAATGRNIKANQKVKDPAAAPDLENAPKVRVKELDMNSAIEAYEKSLNNQAETKQSKAIRLHIVSLIKSMPNGTPITDKKLSQQIKEMRTPEMISNYTKAVILTRNAPPEALETAPMLKMSYDLARGIEWELQRRGAKNTVTNNMVIKAIDTEKMMDVEIGEDPSIPASLPYTARNAIKGITHRTSELQSTARRIASRMMYMGVPFSPNVKSESYKQVRNDVRKMAGELSKSDDISKSVEKVAEYMYNSNLLPEAQREVLRRAAGAIGYDPSVVLARLVAEDADINSSKTAARLLDTVDDDFAREHMLETLSDARTSMREGVAYTLNGLISSAAARRRFAPLMTYGNMTVENSMFDPMSPKNKFVDDIPSEFAEDFAFDYINQASPNTIQAMQDFVQNGNIKPYYVDVSTSGPMRSGIKVDEVPRNKIAAMSFDKVSDDVALILDDLKKVRGQINSLRARGGTKNRIQHLYYEEEALRAELAEAGFDDPFMSTPVLIRDTKPANFNRDMIPSDGIVKTLSRAILDAEDKSTGVSQASAVLNQMQGAYRPDQMVQTLSEAAGGEQKLYSIMRDMGFTSVNILGRKTMLKETDVRDLRAALFDEPEMAFNDNMPSDPIPHMVDAMEVANDGGDQAFEEVLSSLEIAGMPKKATDILAKIKRGKEITPKEGRELRRVSKFGLARNNAQRLARAGMRTLAEFFQPSDAGAGHFERYALRTGQFLGPLQRMLIKLPDSGNGMKRWLRNGLGEMLFAYNVGESLGSMLRIPPPTRKEPITSHLHILNALRNEQMVNTLTSQEREIYEYMRTYFKDARDRLVSAGYDVGNIKKNYVPQVWRRDLIEADREGFVDILSKYFTAEHAERGAVLQPQQARLKAEGVADRLIHEDGVWTGDAHAFNRGGERGVDHVDYQRLIRLDEGWATQFTDMRNPDKNLAKFLENDLMVIGSKYADSVEQRIDIANNFGVGGFGYFDYLAIMNGGVDAISKLLRSNKVLRKDYKLFIDPNNSQDEVAGEGAHAIFQSALFMAPIQKTGPDGQLAAQKKAEDLAMMAHKGATSDEIFEEIMGMMTPEVESSAADQMRRHFSFRARAIANALTDTKGLDKDFMPQSHMVEEADNLYKAVARKPVYNASFEKHLEKPSSWLRSFNSVTLLPFVTLSSLGDVMLPLIRSGSLRASTEAYRKWMVDPDVGPAYREMIRNVGASTQNIVQERMSRAFGMDTTRFSAGFFTAIGLTDWTNTMRDISAAVSYEWFKSQQEIAVRKPNTKAGRQARRVLDEYGLKDLYAQPGMNIERILRSGSSAETDQMYYQVAGAMHRFANETIFTPNPLDIPLWAQSPIGQMIFQLKSFPLMMTRMGFKVYKEAKDHKNFYPLMYMAGAPILGAGVVGAKDVVQGRGGEENREFALRDRKAEFLKEYGLSDDEGIAIALGWYRDGLMQMGGLGLIGSLMYDTASQLDNGAYGAQRITEMLLGPSLGVLHDTQTILAGGVQAAENLITGEGANGKPRAAVREIVSRVPGIGQVSGARELIVDTFAGEKGD